MRKAPFWLGSISFFTEVELSNPTHVNLAIQVLDNPILGLIENSLFTKLELVSHRARAFLPDSRDQGSNLTCVTHANNTRAKKRVWKRLMEISKKAKNVQRPFIHIYLAIEHCLKRSVFLFSSKKMKRSFFTLIILTLTRKFIAFESKIIIPRKE